MTEEELKAIEARCNAATPGPWSSGDYGCISNLESTVTVGRACWNGRHDAEFIAHARTDVPKMLAEIRKLREALEYYANELNYLPTHAPDDESCPTRFNWSGNYYDENGERFAMCRCDEIPTTRAYKALNEGGLEVG